MTKSTAILLWAPRIAGIVVAVFLALFAMDAFNDKPVLEVLPGFVIHLVPAVVVLAAVAIAWRHPLAGTAAFVGLALFYAVTAHWRLGWIAVIGGPLVVVAALFAVSWRYRAAA